MVTNTEKTRLLPHPSVLLSLSSSSSSPTTSSSTTSSISSSTFSTSTFPATSSISSSTSSPTLSLTFSSTSSTISSPTSSSPFSTSSPSLPLPLHHHHHLSRSSAQPQRVNIEMAPHPNPNHNYHDYQDPEATWGTAGDLNSPPLPLPAASPPAVPSSCSCSCSGLSSSSSRRRKGMPGSNKSSKNGIMAYGGDSRGDDDHEGGERMMMTMMMMMMSRKEAGETTASSRSRVHLSAHLLISLLAATIVSAAAGVSNDLHTGSGVKVEPQFGEVINNVTVAAGREAQLSCTVDNLGEYKVGWLKVDSQTILSLQKRVVTHNTRITVTHDEHRTWSLHIKQVKEADSGCYMCQINTRVMKNQVGCIKVHVPPDFVNNRTSSDTTVNEGDSVTLGCVAEGFPEPHIKWKREDGRHIIIKSTSSRDASKKLDSVPGSNLTLVGVTRKQMGAYLCIASNNVPPTVSKRIILYVNFSPVVKVDNQLIGAPLGTDVEIQCHVEAFPKAVNYWERDNGEMLLDGKKYKLQEEVESYRVTMKLVIRNFTKQDSGQYKCISTNSLGKADTSIRLYEIEVPTPRTTTEHQYYSYLPTPKSKSGGPLDLRVPNGIPNIIHGNEGLVGAGGVGGGVVGSWGEIGGQTRPGNDIERDHGRQLQRQRQDYGKGRVNEFGIFGSPVDGNEGQGSGAASFPTSRIDRRGWVLRFACLLVLLLLSSSSSSSSSSGFELRPLVREVL